MYFLQCRPSILCCNCQGNGLIVMASRFQSSPSLFFRRLIQHSHSHSPLGPISHLLPSVMSISNRQFYVLHGPCNSPIQKDSVMILPLVDSVDVTAWAESIPDNDPRQLHIEIRQEQMGVQAAEAVKRSGILTWNEEF